MSSGPISGWASTVVVGSITGIALTTDRLPALVASHFGPAGLATGFVTRETYLRITIGLVVLVPALGAAILAVAARHLPQLLNLPNRAYWLAPERRDATIEYLSSHTAWLAALFAVFTLSVHFLLIRANHTVPARLETAPFLTILLAFAVAMIAWLAVLARRFRRD